MPAALVGVTVAPAVVVVVVPFELSEATAVASLLGNVKLVDFASFAAIVVVAAASAAELVDVALAAGLAVAHVVPLLVVVVVAAVASLRIQPSTEDFPSSSEDTPLFAVLGCFSKHLKYVPSVLGAARLYETF